MRLFWSFVFACTLATAAQQVWTVQVEEPTGLYRRSGEVIAIPLAKLGAQGPFTVIDSAGREAPTQVSARELLFPVSLVPGDRPAYRVACCDTASAGSFRNPIVVRRLGSSRVEFGNGIFRAIIDVRTAAFVEVYSYRTGPQRMLNLVETTPEGPDALKGDVHEDSPEARTFSPKPVPGVDGPNTGWTTLGGTGGFSKIELVETGPLRGRLRLERKGETWDIWWTANGAWFRWNASRGFRFASISASPYEPFDRCVDGSEYHGPEGPGDQEPAPHDIGPRDWPNLPGGHMVYYQREQNYGALGIVALDPDLRWIGSGTRKFIAEKAGGDTEIAITFPEWKGIETFVEARKENRLIREPVLVQIQPAASGRVAVRQPAEREETVQRGSGSATQFQQQSISLDGEWQLAFVEKGHGPPESGWRTVAVPGTAHIQWLKPDQIYDHTAEWVSYQEWWYKRTFRIPETFSGKRLRLQFEATDYYADTYVNGRFAGHHEGYIDPYEYDVTPLARVGAENEIMVRTWTPVTYYWRHRPYTIKGAYGAVDQKPDDITAVGITRPVRLAASAGAVIRDAAIDTRLAGSSAEVAVQLQADLPSAADGYTWELTLSPRNFSGAEHYQARTPARPESRVVIPVENPRLWWTWDHGRPNLYTLDIRLLNPNGKAVDGRSLAVGIREVEKIGWDFYLNGRRMFIRGTNYYDSIYMSSMDREKYERDMQLILGMNVNMIRLHCHFSNPDFYDLADERGVLIWQDYLEAWYPHDVEFAQRAAALYDNHVRYVRNHPSVAIWITSDEEDFENYRQITKHLAPRPFLLDPQRRPVHRSTGRFGDSHVYHGWYDGSIWDYTRMDQKFVSELGATCLPNYETLVKFMGDQWPIRDHEGEWIWRRLQIPQAMKAWGDPGNTTMQDYIPQTQAYVARLFQIALERARERKSEGAGGILHFHAIDIWPSVTMAAIDFERRPTKVYDVVRRSFEPVAALFQYDRDRWRPGETFRCGIWAVNDRWDAVPGASVRWRIVSPAGEALKQGAFPAPMEANSARRLGDVEWTASEPGHYELHAELLDGSGSRTSENIFEFQVTAANR